MAATTLLAPLPASPKFAMERSLPLRTMSERKVSDQRKSGEPGSPKARYSTTTMKYSQMPLPTPPDSAGLEGFQLQLTLMPPTPGENPDPLYIGALPPKKKRRSIQVPYLLTVADVEDETGTEAFSPSSTNYSAVSEFGPFSRHRDTVDMSIPLPERASQIINMKKRSPLSLQTSADDFASDDNSSDKENNLKPTLNTLTTSNLKSDYQALYSPITPVTPKTPFGPSATPKLSLAERRARKVPTPLTQAPPRPTNGSNEDLPTSPPPLTARSLAQVPQSARSIPVPQSARSIAQVPMSAVKGSGTTTPQTATFVPKSKVVSTPITPSFPILAAPQTSTPKSAAFFSPRSGAFPPYVPHSATAMMTASPRQATFLPIHEDVDRDALRSPKGVKMLVEHAQGQQTGFISGQMPPQMREKFELLWQVANAQADVDEIFPLGMYRQDSFTFTGAEHYTFGPDFSAPFYRISAHPSHEQDATFSDLKIHRCSPFTAAEIPVIHLQLEAPTLESSGVVALIYPQVAGLMLEGGQTDIENNPKMDVSEEKECCRLVYEVGKGFALYHPFKGEDGGWLNVEVEGRVGFDAIGANGTISLLNPQTDEALVTLDFATCELFINAQACKAIPSLFIVDVAVAAVLTVATVEGRRLRVIQEDLDRILAYEQEQQHLEEEEQRIASFHSSLHSSHYTSPTHSNSNIEVVEQLHDNLSKAALADYSFAAAVGRMGVTIAATEGQKVAAVYPQKRSGNRFGNWFRRFLRRLARKPAQSPEFEQVVRFEAPQFQQQQQLQQDTLISNHRVYPHQPIMVVNSRM